jgi:hypothetical protein
MPRILHRWQFNHSRSLLHADAISPRKVEGITSLLQSSSFKCIYLHHGLFAFAFAYSSYCGVEKVTVRSDWWSAFYI